MSHIINEDAILTFLNDTGEPSFAEVQRVLHKSANLERLDLSDVAVLLKTTDPVSIENIFQAAHQVKNAIYGNRIVFFAPLYISNHCINDCRYCGFRASNKIVRSMLSIGEVKSETKMLLMQGHKRILLVSGESYPAPKGLDYVFELIDAIYSVKYKENKIRRINVNIAPLDGNEFERLRLKPIGTYQLFQETYHRKTYTQVHPTGPKSDYDYRLEGIDRAMKAGFEDVGLGVLFGLFDWRFEVMALLQHVESLEKRFGVGPHTISVPRLEPAEGADLAMAPPAKVSDADFRKLIAILRLAVPYTGIILSTREAAQLRREALKLGVSQVSAGSRTNPGGYTSQKQGEQFSLGDYRTLDEVIYDLLKMDYLPSFCTACYRLGRTGLDFMEYAKPGDIKKKCGPNGLMTLKEYLTDFATPQVKALGEMKLLEWTEDIEDQSINEFLKKTFAQIDEGARDIFV
ncbi:MAG: [FeFe] hydrogenase H-cluster radical SAM maturase HydG [Candidatus Margulisiibacteriota bacterium]|nr:MAG: [FeFe] hydrogenase H-cluster radical SAM maturase HydG [Candidatus Margulisbacteria bacterium GWD2_39_127]OGI01813.1 MAG: [FeFe] hydrogenase H-cluster radical SAM maturase HydG [Candidatus Margulisbacteria bacterium GWF2_38_17]OGI10135.1 MAG: [FeFe] hydrogenase H-cluster radical SAM maturase HydG [Candidatus Margulisbacteria bacterium GWE2_39_32]PZM79528.1 MAG: [FeFe] hydrogenase H-cluster radical SAM maturase HydG [Candidatus Margulisiibacteriota bacterium]HAR63799.1 [FeFe] hydrogenase